MRIRAAGPQDEAKWRVLWHGYNLFYETPALGETVTAATWARILDDHSAIGCLVAQDDTAILGFLHYVVHPRTWSERDCCYLEDLYVDETVRGQGVARALCAALKTLCTERGLSRIYWHTRERNAAARAFYDQIGARDDFVHYVSELG